MVAGNASASTLSAPVQTGQLHRMEERAGRIKYLAEKNPLFSGNLARNRENSTCRYIRDHLYPLLDERQKRKVAVAQGKFGKAAEKGREENGLSEKIEMLGRLLEKIRKEGGATGEELGAWEKACLEGEALALKKRGTAALKLYVESYETECLCLAENSLEAAVKRWERLGSMTHDYAKALYRLALAKYGREKDEEAVQCAEKCMQFCNGKQGLEWLSDNAQEVKTQAMTELNRERLER